MSDWEYSDENCPKCNSQLATRRCGECENGEVLIDEDDQTSAVYECDRCDGNGHLEWCRSCGWDAINECFLSPQYETEFLAKGRATNASN